jgi:sulfate/thiosulfate transport system substrate-binding protein
MLSITNRSRQVLLAILTATLLIGAATLPAATLLNASYDVTREFYKDYNAAFIAHWKSKTGETIVVQQSHGGSSKQVRSVIDGLEADVVTMNQSLDIDALANAHLIPADWANRLPNQSVPSTSTILFLVRKGNPKGIKDWSDLVRPDVSVVIPNPKTSGNGRYSYLAAWGYALRRPGGNENEARNFVERLFGRVPVLDTGGRGATTTFAQRGIGDVLLTFENEIALTQREFPKESFEAVVPSTSILAENPVVWVDKAQPTSPKRIWNISTVPKPRNWRQNTISGHSIQSCSKNTQIAFHPCLFSVSKRYSVAGHRRKRSISPTAVSLIRSTKRNNLYLPPIMRKQISTLQTFHRQPTA